MVVSIRPSDYSTTANYDGHSVIADLKPLDDMVDINCADTVLCGCKLVVKVLAFFCNEVYYIQNRHFE